MLEGLRQNVTVPNSRVLHLHTERQGATPQVTMRGVLESLPRSRRIAVLCYNDVNALGALEAVEEAGRSEDVAILSQGAVREVRLQLRKRRSAIWGAVAHFPERFGQSLVPLMMRVLRGESIPSTTYTEHVLLTASNVSRYYSDGDA